MQTLTILGGVATLALWLGAEPDPGESEGKLIVKAQAAFRLGKTDEALKLADQAVERGPASAQAWLFRGSLRAALRQADKAVVDFDKAVELTPKSAEVYDLRGSERFKLGRIADSIADFDTAIKLDKSREPGHWKRGISYYYAGQYDQGKAQFERYQTVDDSDVENAVWRFLCMARKDGVDKARESILKIGDDRRVPMRQVYDLFAGKSKPEDVLSAAQDGSPSPEALNNRLFYAHQYLGLYYEALGDAKRASEHTAQAVAHPIGHYMWDVAKVHSELRRKEPAKKPE